MAITPFIFAPFPDPQRNPNSPRNATELSFTRNFDINRPAVMVFFAHGHKAILERDIVSRQQVLQQLERAGLNAVLVAPQLAYNAKNSDAGRFAEPGFANRFFEEAAMKLANMHAQQHNQARPSQQTLNTFRNMPITVVSYSGGYGASLAILEQSMRQNEMSGLSGITQANGQQTLGQRIQGAVLLDTLYGGSDTIQRFANQPHRPYVVSNYIENNRYPLTEQTNTQLSTYFASRNMLSTSQLTRQHNVRIYEETGHHNHLVQNGLARALQQIPGYRADTAIAQVQPDPQTGNRAPVVRQAPTAQG